MDGDDIRWRPPSFLLIPFIFCTGFIFIYDIFEFKTFRMSNSVFQEPKNIKRRPEEGFLIKTDGCRIPDMNAFDPSIMQFIFKEEPVICDKNNTPLVESNLTSIYVLTKSFRIYGINDKQHLKCCYSVYFRVIPLDNEMDNKGEFKPCLVFKDVAHISDEFIRVVCTYNDTIIYRDFFAFVPIKTNINVQVSKPQKKPINILIIGLDAISRLNLHRQMPKTVKMLKELEAVEFFGYNKIGDNTYPNLIAALTGLTEEELVKTCWPTTESKFDECPFIWDQFSKNGYLTAFGEDSSWMGIFNYVKNGFKYQPTHYYWGHFNRISETEIGNHHEMNVDHCVGSRLVYTTILNYMDRFTATMKTNSKTYFSFFWSSSLSHDFLNKPQIGDDAYAKFFNKLHFSNILNDTVLIFMSDHGIRWGDIRSTYQGRLEERLPFLFIVLPEFYKNNFWEPYSNLRKNARRLTTPFDLHKTLIDLLSPYTLPKRSFSKNSNRKVQRSYSLFEKIPETRSCDSANIATHWCTCQKSLSIATTNKDVEQAALFTVQHINEQLTGFAQCANLSLAEIKNARLHSFEEHVLVGNNYTQDYTIVLRTIPGNAVFESTIREYLSDNYRHFNITGTISRINLYGNQSLCISEFHLKLYCYCKALLFA